MCDDFDKKLSLELYWKMSKEYFTSKYIKPIHVPWPGERTFLVTKNNKLRLFFTTENFIKYLDLIDKDNKQLYKYSKWIRKSIEQGGQLLDWNKIIVNSETENFSSNKKELEKHRKRKEEFERTIIERKTSRLKYHLISYGCLHGSISVFNVKEKCFARQIEYYGQGSCLGGNRNIIFEHEGKFILEYATRVVVE